MYSRKRGKSGSTKPIQKEPPSWVRHKDSEVEKLVLKLSREGKSSAQIGLILRDSYGIPNVRAITGKKINKILEENKVLPEMPEDLKNMIKRVIALITHLTSNKKDTSAQRGIQITESKIRRLVKYYKKTKKLPAEWEYSRSNVKLLLR